MTDLLAVLEEARSWGFLGPGPVADHVAHAEAFAAAVSLPPDRALDLGSGGGVPGLVLAGRWPTTRWVLLDSQERRTAFLAGAVARLGWQDRVQVVRARAEEAGRDPDLRAAFDLVTARSFGPPAVTAECAAPFLRVGGHLLVSEPPEAVDRWPAAGLAPLGLEVVGVRTGAHRMAALEQITGCPDSYPRAVGRPAKRPLF